MRVLTLISRLPWPLTDGAAIRDYNLLREAARRHEVSLLCFLGKPEDRAHVDALRPYCRRIETIDLVRPPWRSAIRAAWSMVGTRPFITEEYRRAEMSAALARIVDEERVDVVHSHFLHMSQYVGDRRGAAFVHDAHNLEHVLWRRMSETLRNPLKRIFARAQCDKLLRLQRAVGHASEKCVTLSDEDAAEYRRICPEVDVETVPNGADIEYWTPQSNVPEPDTLLYFGNLEWPPQAEAVVYFHDRILPRIRSKRPDVKLYVAGQKPPESVRRLASERVVVTGFVPDMREYIARSSVVVMPLRVGAGTKHRVFQALAMNKPIVCTAVASEGIALTHGETAMLADDPEDFAACTLRLLEDAELARRIGEAGRRLVLERYDWRQIYLRLDAVFVEAVAKRRAAARPS
jgi:sugar transferase (PEP-CTERM/EpsH1 system associated)